MISDHARRSENVHLSNKKRASVFGHVTMVLLALLATRNERLALDYVFIALILCLSFFRFRLRAATAEDSPEVARAWFTRYAAVTLLSALGWGLLVANRELFFDPSRATEWFMMIQVSGIAAAGTNTLTPNRRLAGAFVALVLGPMILALAYEDFWANLPIIGVAFTSQIFLMLQTAANAVNLIRLSEREEQYRLLVDATHEGVLIHVNGIIAEVNPAFTRMFGYRPHELIGTSVFDLVVASEREHNLKQMSVESDSKRHVMVIHRNGELRQCEVYARNLQYKDSAARVICVQDNTLTIAAERALRESSEQRQRLAIEREAAALEALRLKSSFIANMSHEIRTPLNAIIGLTDLLNETSDTEVRARYLRTLKSSGEGLLALVNDILDFSKMEAGHVEFEYGATNLANVIEDQCDLLGARALAKDLTLSIYVDPSLPTSVRTDSGRFGQVILNLVSNAMKFTERGSVSVRCRKVGGTGETVTVRVEVADTGIGIPAELVEKLFSPFTQADSSMSRRFGGTGLGLSICRRLVEGMGGTIDFESVEGRGATFWFELTMPILDASTYRAARPAPAVNVTIITEGLALVDVIGRYTEAWSLPTRVMTMSERAEAGPTVNEVMIGTAEALTDVVTAGSRGVVIIERNLRHRVIAETATPGRRRVATPVRHSDLYDALIDVATPTARPAAVPARNVVAQTVFAPAHVLVVEDNSTNQMLILAIMAKLGFTTQAVVNGIEAVAAVESNVYDLILMDCQMPEMDGFEATRRIRARELGRGGHVPIVALTANVSAEDRQRCLESGMDAFVPKPVRRDQLIAELRKFLKVREDSGEKAG